MDADKALWIAWGRQVRPDSLILSAATMLIAVSALREATRLTGPWEQVVGMIATTSAVFLWIGWWAQNLRTGFIGMIMSSWCWATLAITGMHQQVSVTTWGISWCWAGLGVLLWARDRRENQ